MANRDHLDTLKDQIEKRREWRASREAAASDGNSVPLDEPFPEMDLSGLDLSDADLTEVDLAGARLSQTSLSGCNLYHANLRGANLVGADLTRTLLESADLDGANLSGAYLFGTRFLGSSLLDADLRGVSGNDTIFRDCEMQRVNLVRALLAGAELGEVDLTGATLDNIDLGSANMKSSCLRGVKGIAAVLRSADLSAADLTRAELPNVDLRGATLSGAFLDDAVLDGADLSDARAESYASLISTKLKAARLADCYLTGSILRGAILQDAYLRKATLAAADLRGADLSFGDLSGADLTDAKLRGANLKYTNLARATLERLNVEGATIGGTNFASVDLRTVTGLDLVNSAAPSSVGIDTIILSHGKIPSAFLRDVGVPEDLIRYLSRRDYEAPRYRSCSLIHAPVDQVFADTLMKTLRERGVDAWSYDHTQGGSSDRAQIHSALRSRDKLVIVCSEGSLSTPYVVDKILTGMDLEERSGLRRILSVRLDEYIFSRELFDISTRKLEDNDWFDDWVLHLKQRRPLLDFTRWREGRIYQSQVGKLLRELGSVTVEIDEPAGPQPRDRRAGYARLGRFVRRWFGGSVLSI
jgi:uncharacterized protein YjbI with pentapeptide repeats